MLTAKKVRFWYRVHKWTSLVCTAFLLMSCITGLPLVFGDEIDAILPNHAVLPAPPPANAPRASLDGIVATARQQYPGQRVLFLGGGKTRIFINMAPSLNPKPGETHLLTFDAYRGNLLEDLRRHPRPELTGVAKVVDATMDCALRLHINLYAKLPGKFFLGAMALLFIVALVSGAVVYGPFMRRLNFGTVRKNKATRFKWFDLHNLLGIVTLSWALVVGATGLMNALDGVLFNTWYAHTAKRLEAPYHGKPMPKQFSSVDAAVATAQAALPGMEVVSMQFPDRNHPRHYLVWTRGNQPLTAKLFTPVLIDAQTGQLTSAKGLPWYLRAIEVSRPLHFGDYGGLPLKIIWALFDVALIFVLLSGLYLWLSRRKTPVEDELDRLVSLEELSAEPSNAGVLAR